jgi:hypothetical protein
MDDSGGRVRGRRDLARWGDVELGGVDAEAAVLAR